MATTTTITKMLLRRGNDSDRKQTVLASGEPGWTLDTKRLWIGDGVTPGGYPALSAADEHLKFLPEDQTVPQRLDINIQGLASTLGGSIVPSTGQNGRFFHPATQIIETHHDLFFRNTGDTKITSDSSTGNSFKIARENDGTINIGNGAIVVDQQANGGSTVTLNVDNVTMASATQNFNNGQFTNFEDKSIDFNVSIDGSGNVQPEGTGAESSATGIYMSHKNYLSAGYVRIGEGSDIDAWSTLELAPTVYKPHWDSSNYTGRGAGYTAGWEGGGRTLGQSDKAPKPVVLHSQRPKNWSGEAHLVLESGLMVYGDASNTGDFNAFKINQDLDSSATPTFAGINIADPGGGNPSAIPVTMGGTGTNAFLPNAALISGATGTSSVQSIALDACKVLVGTGSQPVAAYLGGGVGITIDNSSTSGNIQIKNTFAPGGWSVSDRQSYIDRWYNIQTQSGTLTPSQASSELTITGGKDMRVSHSGSGSGATITIAHNNSDTAYGERKTTAGTMKDWLVGNTASDSFGGHVPWGIKVDDQGHVASVNWVDLDNTYAKKDGTNASGTWVAQAAGVARNTSNGNYQAPINFRSSNTADGGVYNDDGITYNPSTNTLTCGKYIGDGSSLTNVDASTIGGQTPTAVIAAGMSKSQVSSNSDIPVALTPTSATDKNIYVDSANGIVFNPSTNKLSVKGDIVAFSTSDITLKENVTPISDPLFKLSRIGGYEFDWNEDAGLEGHDVGVIAQEVEEVLPEVVATRESGTKAVRYEKLVPLLIEGIKELTDRVQYLESQLMDQ